MYLGARKWILSKLVFCLQNCKAFGGSRVETRRCISRLEHLFWANLCFLLDCKAFGGSRAKTRRCISRQEDVFWANLCCLLNCKAFGGSRVKTRKCISRQEDVFWGKKMYFEQTCVVYLIIRPSAGRGLRPRQEEAFWAILCCLLNRWVEVSDSKMYHQSRKCILSKLVFFTEL